MITIYDRKPIILMQDARNLVSMPDKDVSLSVQKSGRVDLFWEPDGPYQLFAVAPYFYNTGRASSDIELLVLI